MPFDIVDRIRDGIGSTEDPEPTLAGDDLADLDPDRVLEDFRRFLDHESVSVDGDRSHLVEELRDIVSRYEDVLPPVRSLRTELSERSDGDGVSLLDVFEGEDVIDQWNQDHPEGWSEAGSLLEEFLSIFEDITVSSENMPEGLDALDDFYQRLNRMNEFVGWIE